MLKFVLNIWAKTSLDALRWEFVNNETSQTEFNLVFNVVSDYESLFLAKKVSKPLSNTSPVMSMLTLLNI